jgi:phage gp36-like protein
MPYVELSDLEAVIPSGFLTEALDDDNDGVIDAWTAVQAAACRAVDAILGKRFAVPFTDPAPATVREAAFLFAAEACYTRRGVEFDKNPFGKSAAAARSDLRAIARGDEPLAPSVEREKPSVSIISSPSRTASDGLAL